MRLALPKGPVSAADLLLNMYVPAQNLAPAQTSHFASLTRSTSTTVVG
jgi:hypothetical protein